MASLVDFVRTEVKPTDYYQSVFPDMNWPTSGSEGRVPCVFHEDNKTPSLSLNPDTGQWYCHGCGVGGKSVLSFHGKHNEITVVESARVLFHRYIHAAIPEKRIREWARALQKCPSVLRYLVKERMLSEEVITSHLLGYDGRRITIPVFNEFGIAVNAKLYDPLSKQHELPKMTNYRRETEARAYGSPAMLYPVSQLIPPDDLGGTTDPATPAVGTVVVAEGEFDALALISIGVPAVTTTAGSKSWPKQYNSLFRGKKVIIAYDNDNDGTKYTRKIVVPNIAKLAKTVHRLEIPKEVGKDVTDWIRNDPAMRTRKGWRTAFKEAKLLLENDDATIEESEIATVSLDQASQARYCNKQIGVKALITGKDTAPYLLPKTYRVSCSRECDSCPLADSEKPYRQVSIDPKDPAGLSYLDETEDVVKRKLFQKAGFVVSPKCKAKCEVIEQFNIENLLVIPTLDSASMQYVMRSVYYVGHGLQPNRGYEFEGTTVPHPQTQQATHLFTKAKAAQDEIESFVLGEDVRGLLKVFRPGNLGLSAHLMGIAEWQSRNITKIRERPDLHVAVDLIFHSARAFEFNGDLVPRGMLDALIIGDTRCGKGYVAEGLARYYGLGEVASGENCSFAGLIGGLENIGKRFIVKWGIIPLNHNRLVIIDEASSLSEESFSRMSRVRSEGIAEINKIQRQSTRANTRLLWLSNPRDGRPIMERNHGVMAIKDLVGANEDISRFDFALTVATNEVPSEVINSDEEIVHPDSDKYPVSLCRALVLWAWSRRPDQIRITDAASKRIIAQAIEFGKAYSPSIPLVQAENIRIKIAKLAVAVAARVFSSDSAGELLIVGEEHVDCACQFLRMAYSKPSMGYDAYSKSQISGSTIKDVTTISDAFKPLGRDRASVIHGLIELHRVTPDNLTDYVGDMIATRSLIGDLVKLRCLTRIDNWYLKNPAFNQWLRAERSNSNGRGK